MMSRAALAMTMGVFLWFVACQKTGPMNFKSAEFQCDNCRMSIVDMRFKAEVLSPKGRVFHFDSVECLLRWSAHHPDEVGSQWVTDFFHPQQWIALDKAFILKSERLPSPMGAFLSAYVSDADFEKAVADYGGHRVSVPDAAPSGNH